MIKLDVLNRHRPTQKRIPADILADEHFMEVGNAAIER
jgi:hypothetical protein